MELRDLALPQLAMAADLPILTKVGGENQPTELFSRVKEIPEISAIKIGPLTMGREFTLDEVVAAVEAAGKAVICDPQKMGYDTPRMTQEQSRLFGSVADAVIVFPKTLQHWRKAYDTVETECKSQLVTVLYSTDGLSNVQKRLGLAVEILKDIEVHGGDLGGVMLPANNQPITHAFIDLLSKYKKKPVVISAGVGESGEFAYKAALTGTDIGIADEALYGSEVNVEERAKGIFAALKRGYATRKNYEQKNGIN